MREALPHFERDTFDYLVNNGGFSRGGMIADVTEEDIDALVDVHFKGVLLLTQQLLPLLADGGSIVNLSTGLARFTAPQRAVYGAIKGAVEVLTRYMAAELGPRGITANVIAPGPVATDFSGGIVRDTPEFQEHLAVADAARARSRSPTTSAPRSRTCCGPATAGSPGSASRSQAESTSKSARRPRARPCFGPRRPARRRRP